MMLNIVATSLRMRRRCGSPGSSTLQWMFAVVVLCLIASPTVFLMSTAAPLVMPDLVDPVPIPEDFVANEFPKTGTNVKDDSTIKLDLSEFTDAELIRLAKVLQKELETSPASKAHNKAPPRIEFQQAPPKLQEPVWILPVNIENDGELYPRDRRGGIVEQPVLLLDEDPRQQLQLENSAPVEYVIVEPQAPPAAGGDLLMATPLSDDQVDELELRERLDELGDFLKERAWRQPE